MKKKNNFFTILWHGHPRVAIALLLIVFNLVIIALFTAILSIVSGNPFFDELAYIFTYTMCSDGIYDFTNGEEDLICFVIKIVLTVIQMVIFSGALIGFTTDILQNTIDKTVNNVGKIKLYNHYVFLNWSSIGPQIIYDLSFLDGEKNIVILSEENKDDVMTSIESLFVEHKRKLKGVRIFIKEGSPSSVKHLDDVSLEDAKYVGVLLASEENPDNLIPSPRDLNVLKILLNIIKITPHANIVVETESAKTVEKIEDLLATMDETLSQRVIAFSHNDVIGHILARSVINSTFSNLYHNLLSYDGCEFYGIEPMDIEEALYLYNDCIPICNFDDDGKVDENGNTDVEQLYILSDTEDTLGVRSEKKRIVKPLTYKENIIRENFTLFTISDGEDTSIIIDEINQYNAEFNTFIEVKSYSYRDKIEDIIEVIKQTQGKKKILLLSTESGSNQAQDTDIFLSALSLKISGCLEDVEILAEIINPSNYVALRNIGIMSVIMSNKIISLFMLQVLTHPGSKRFYRDIISTNSDDNAGTIDVDVLKASELLEFNEECLTFSCQSELVQSFYFASNKTRMLIGLRKSGNVDNEIRFLCDAMDKEENIMVYPNDELILINYEN